MSLPEMQPEGYGMQPEDQPDSGVDRLALSFCRSNIERLIEEARMLNELSFDHPDEQKLYADVTDHERDDRLLKQERESVSFFVIKEDNRHAYHVCHEIWTTGVRRMLPLILKETWLFFDAKGRGEVIFNQQFSNFGTYLNPGHALRYESGNPNVALSDDEKELLSAAERDLSRIKTSHLDDIQGLATRALDDVRARALHRPG